MFLFTRRLNPVIHTEHVSGKNVYHAVAIQTHKGKNVTSLPFCCVVCLLPTGTDIVARYRWLYGRLESRRRAHWRAGRVQTGEQAACRLESRPRADWRAGGVQTGEQAACRLESRWLADWRAGELRFVNKLEYVTVRLHCFQTGSVSPPCS